MLALPVLIMAGGHDDPLGELIGKAEGGDAEALYTLATLYDRGFDSIPVDSTRSTALYRQAAEKGNTAAMNYLGYRLISGEYSALGRDVDEGLAWLEKAAMTGDAKAASNIGWMLTDGKYVERDFEKAAFWLDKASEEGLPVAMSQLGDLYREGKGVTQDVQKADSLYRQAFERGLADAGYKLADLRAERYDSIPAEELVNEGRYYYLRSAPSVGVKLFYMAADEGSPEAMALLGDAYTRSLGVPYDYDLSLLYYAKAALAGNPSAQFVIGELLEIFPDALEALAGAELESPLSDDPLYWFEKASLQGVENAEDASEMLLREKPGVLILESE